MNFKALSCSLRGRRFQALEILGTIVVEFSVPSEDLIF